MKAAACLSAALALLLAAPLHAQEPASHPHPTADQCRTDAVLWAKSTWGAIPVNRLWTMNDEMDACVKLDAAHDHLAQYGEVQQAIAFEYLRRLQVFLDRHHLYQQFSDEDQAGVR